MDKSQFEQLYRQQFARLYHYAYDFIGDEQASRDVVSDVFLRLWHDRERIDSGSVVSFLFVSVRNGCMNVLRRRKGWERYEAWFKASQTNEDETYWQTMDERIAEMEREIDRMSPKTRHVLEQCCLEGHTYKEVAAELGITSDGVKKHITKAFATLREHFGVKKR